MTVRIHFRLACLLALLAGLLPTAATAAEFDVSVEDFFFAPDEIFVNVGDTVTWTWAGQAPHNVTPVDESAFEASPTQTEGESSVTFDTEGEVPYFCTLHASPDGSEGMIGTVTVLAEGEPVPEPKPDPRPAPDPGRLPAAEDNVGTALVWSSLFADGSAPSVALGRDDVFADSLTSGAAQGLFDGPLLLTPSETLDQRVLDELVRLGTTTVNIFGGENAISAAVEQELRDANFTVERIQGITRTETANAAAETFFPDATAAFVVRSHATPGGDETQAFADSLAVGGAAARESIPILLSQTEGLTGTTEQYLMDHPEIVQVYLVGGEAALSAQVVTDLESLGIKVTRLAGPTRFDTNMAVMFEFYGEPEVALLVEGQADDAWVSGFTAASAAESAPILLANGDDLPLGALEGFSFGVQPLCGPGVSAVACERAEIAASSVQFGQPGLLLAAMNGAEEVPDPGPPEVTGDILVKPTAAADAICYEISEYGLDEPVTGAHIHRGAEGVAGDIVIPLTAPGDAGFLGSCAFDLDPAVVAEVFANPADFYANYHTESFPAGALRGQLFETETIGLAELQPDSEVPPADVQGGGFSVLVTDVADHSVLGYYLAYGFADGTQAQAGHVHKAPEGENGPVVHPLQLPTVAGEDGFEGTFRDEGVDTALVEDLLANPDQYYVNLHTEAFPDGALRGQLFNPFAGGPPPGDGGPPAAPAALMQLRR